MMAEVLELMAKDHPEANGRKPKPGACAHTLTFPLADGRVLKVLIGNEGYKTMKELFMAQYKQTEG